MSDSKSILAGASVVDVTPKKSVFLFGYPNVPRWSTGAHDPLLASALYLSDGNESALFIAVDIVFISKTNSARVREGIQKATGLQGSHILVSGTHTHSGPSVEDYLSNEHDPVVPKADMEYVRWMEDRIIEAGINAVKSAEPARVGLGVGDATGVGTNRRDPNGPADLSLPILVAERKRDKKTIAVMLICTMHPTVLHEDSKLISGDFPGLARRLLQTRTLGSDCAVLYHTGAAGNQSPRHVVRGQTFAEAERLGDIVAKAVEKTLPNIKLVDQAEIECATKNVEFKLRSFPAPAAAEAKEAATRKRLHDLRESNAPRTETRTAECDWFGAAETVTLAKAAADGKLARAAAACMPAEVQLIRIGDWKFVGWPGEMFVEFGLSVKARSPNTFIIAYANGECQGYIVTQQAVDEGGYEASNAVFKSPESGDALVNATLDLLK